MIMCTHCEAGDHDHCAENFYGGIQDENTWYWTIICDCACEGATDARRRHAEYLRRSDKT